MSTRNKFRDARNRAVLATGLFTIVLGLVVWACVGQWMDVGPQNDRFAAWVTVEDQVVSVIGGDHYIAARTAGGRTLEGKLGDFFVSDAVELFCNPGDPTDCAMTRPSADTAGPVTTTVISVVLAIILAGCVCLVVLSQQEYTEDRERYRRLAAVA